MTYWGHNSRLYLLHKHKNGNIGGITLKRLIILAGAITLLAGTTLFANNLDNTPVTKDMRDSSTHALHMGNGRNSNTRHCNENGKKRHHIQNKEIQANHIKIQERKLELKKEILKDSPDWNKVEKLNKEIGAIVAENKTIMMKERALNRKN